MSVLVCVYINMCSIYIYIERKPVLHYGTVTVAGPSGETETQAPGDCGACSAQRTPAWDPKVLLCLGPKDQ